jgi:hypothetical protein
MRLVIDPVSPSGGVLHHPFFIWLTLAGFPLSIFLQRLVYRFSGVPLYCYTAVTVAASYFSHVCSILFRCLLIVIIYLVYCNAYLYHRVTAVLRMVLRFAAVWSDFGACTLRRGLDH